MASVSPRRSEHTPAGPPPPSRTALSARGPLAGGGQAPLPASPPAAPASGRQSRPRGAGWRVARDDEHQRGARRPCGPRGRVRGSALPERVRPQAAGGRAGRAVPARAPGQPVPVARPVRGDRQSVPAGGPALRRATRHPGAAAEEAGPHPLGRPQARPRAALPGGRRGRRPLRGGGHRGRPGVPVGVQRHATRSPRSGSRFSFFKEQRRVGVYYFYVLDPDFGPGFIKVCTYFPYPAKVWVNGHEWAKRQADRAGIGFTALANGFAACDDPRRSRRSATGFGPGRRAGLLRPLDRGDPGSVHRRRSGRRLLVGAVGAPGRGLPHPGLRRPSPGPGLLRGAGGRQHGHRPAPRGGGRVRPSLAAQHTGDLPHPRLRRRHRGQPGVPLQAQPGQAVPEGREGAANRDRHQQAVRPGSCARLDHLPELVAKGAGQPSSANDRACRSGLCHRLCALRAHPPALHTGGPTNRSPALRGPTRHGPGRRPVRASSTPSPASPTRAFAGSSPGCSGGTTPPTR